MSIPDDDDHDDHTTTATFRAPTALQWRIHAEFKGKRAHHAQLRDKLSGQRSAYLTLNSATDNCENDR